VNRGSDLDEDTDDGNDTHDGDSSLSSIVSVDGGRERTACRYTEGSAKASGMSKKPASQRFTNHDSRLSETSTGRLLRGREAGGRDACLGVDGNEGSKLGVEAGETQRGTPPSVVDSLEAEEVKKRVSKG
jgi:hypothetical protein